jgi:ABC-type nitrate/sulfonate/bicarbonate transport system substrate-binding protein
MTGSQCVRNVGELSLTAFQTLRSLPAMKRAWLLPLILLFAPASLFAEKLTLAHVAINPAQGLFWIARDSGLLAKYGFTADVVLVPGSPRTVQALIAGDLDYIVAGTAAVVRARIQGADVVMVASPSTHSSQRVVVRPDSTLNSLKDVKGKIIGVTQFGSAGDTFLRTALRKVGLKEADVTILQMGGTPGVTQALEAGRIEVGVLGESAMLLVFQGKARQLKGASARELGIPGLDGPLTTTERKLRRDRGGVLRFVQAYVEAIHYFKANKPGTVRVLQKYMRGLSEQQIGAWVDDVKANLQAAPYPDDESLRSELEQINAPKSQSMAYFVDRSILDEIKKSGFIDRLYR